MEIYEPLRCPALADILTHGVEAGCRNDVAFRLAQFYSAPKKYTWTFEDDTQQEFCDGLEYSEVYTLLKYWNVKNTPPLLKSELAKCVRQGLKTPCDYGKFGQGVLASGLLQHYCDKQIKKCIIHKIFKQCDGHR